MKSAYLCSECSDWVKMLINVSNKTILRFYLLLEVDDSNPGSNIINMSGWVIHWFTYVWFGLFVYMTM